MKYPVLKFTAAGCLLAMCGAGSGENEDARSLSDRPVTPVAVGVSPLATSGPKPNPVTPATDTEIKASLGRGVDFLLTTQNEDGSWGTFRTGRPEDVLAPVPGSHHAFTAAVTALGLMAMIETRPLAPAEKRPAMAEAIDWAEAYLLKDLRRVRRATPMVFYNTWAHAFATQALARLHDYRAGQPEKQQQIEALIRHQFSMLEKYELVDGGWGYYDFAIGTQHPAGSSSSFTTSSVLVALSEARRIGVAPPERLTRRAVASVRRQRKPDFTYLYGEHHKYRPQAEIDRPGGSLGRSQVCNLALRRWGDEQVTDAVLKTWLDRLFARNLWLDIGRKRPIPHESWMAVAGYFYYYGHYYGALCMDELPAEERGPFRIQMARLMVDRQERDGSWWDFPMYGYHQQYGTAFALMTLGRCLEEEATLRRARRGVVVPPSVQEANDHGTTDTTGEF